MFYYGHMLLNGIGIEINKEEGLYYIKMSVDKGFSKAINSNSWSTVFSFVDIFLPYFYYI